MSSAANMDIGFDATTATKSKMSAEALGIRTRHGRIERGVSDFEETGNLGLIAVLSGTAEGTLSGPRGSVSDTLSQGSIIAIRGRERMQLELDRDISVIFIALNFNPELDQAFLNCTSMAQIYGTIFRDPFAFQTIVCIADESASECVQSRTLVASAARLLKLTVRLQGKRLTNRSPSQKREACQNLHKALHWIEDNLGEQVSVGRMASVAGVSEWYFLRAFKQRFGIPPHQYVLQRRLTKSQELLKNGATPLAQIAEKCGFSSQSHMTTAFKQRFGITPGRYRSQRVAPI